MKNKYNESVARSLLKSDEDLHVLFDWHNKKIKLKHPARKKELAESIADVLNEGSQYYFEVYQLMKNWVTLHKKRSVNGAVTEAEFIVIDARLHNEYKVKPELTPSNLSTY